MEIRAFFFKFSKLTGGGVKIVVPNLKQLTPNLYHTRVMQWSVCELDFYSEHEPVEIHCFGCSA